MHEVLGFVREYNAYFSIGAIGFSLIILVYTLVLSSRLAKVSRRRSVRLADASASEIIDLINEQSELLSDLKTRLDEVNTKQVELGQSIANCLQSTSIVRFNAFDDVGGEQSFAFALLDGNDNGVVISSLYGRQDSRMYIKSITRGEAERVLSSEEQRAIGSRPRKTTVA